MLLYVIRFFVFAAIYIGATLLWAGREGGFGGLGIIGGGIILAGGAAAAWLIAAFVGRYVRNAGVRLVVHVVSAVFIFIGLSFVILLLLKFDPSHEDVFIQAFTGIVATGALADGAVGLWHDQARVDAHG